MVEALITSLGIGGVDTGPRPSVRIVPRPGAGEEKGQGNGQLDRSEDKLEWVRLPVLCEGDESTETSQEEAAAEKPQRFLSRR